MITNKHGIKLRCVSFNVKIIQFIVKQTRPGTPKSVATISGNGHRFLRKNNAKVRPSGQVSSSTKSQENSVDTKASNSKSNGYQDCNIRNSYCNNNPVTINVNGKKRNSIPSRSSSILANIPICTTQKCLIKYGCAHC